YGITRNPAAVAKELEPYLGKVSGADAVRHVAIGRNNWIVWTAGNDVLWDRLNRDSKGALDLLKTVSNLPNYNRSDRWNCYGPVESAEGSGEPDLREPEQQSRRPILLDLAHLHVRSGSDELRLAALQHLPSRRARHLPRLLGRDQQPAHHERDLQPPRAAHAR